MKACLKNTQGFTLLEMLLSVAIIALIAGISIPVYQSFGTRNDLDIARTTFTQSIYRAQILAKASDGDIASGIKIIPGNIIIFRGLTYATRDASLDELFNISPTITFTGNTEIVFARFTGSPSVTGTTTFTSINNETKTITTNTKGVANYQ